MFNMSDRKRSIGILYQDQAGNGLTHDFFASVLSSFLLEAEKKGYTITFINCLKFFEGRKSYVEHIKEWGYDGIAMICADFKDDEINEVFDSGIPLVTIDEPRNGVISILSDNSQGIRDLVYYAAAQGHKKIAYIYGDLGSVTSLRINNFKEACAEMRIEVPDEYLRPGKFRSISNTVFQVEELLRLPNKPTCILCSDDYAAIGALNVLKARGLDVPNDISIAAYDGLDIPSRYSPRLCTIKQDTESMGRIAADKLISLIEDPSTEIKDVYIPTTLVEGETVKKLV